MRVLGVDPGSRATGWGVVEWSGPEDCALVACGVIRPAGGSFSVGLHRLRERFAEVVQRAAPEAAAVELPFHGTNARTALRLAHARGVLLEVLGALGVPVSEYTPATVKHAVTGNGGADKSQVRAMVARWLGAAATEQARADAWDALAVALCHALHARFDSTVERARRVRDAHPTSRKR